MKSKRRSRRDRSRSPLSNRKSTKGGLPAPRGRESSRREERGRSGGRDSGKVLRGSIDKNRKGFAFLVFEKKGREDVFIPPRQAQHLFPGDRVEVTLDGQGRLNTLKVVEHRFREVVGRYSLQGNGRNGGGWVIYERKRIHEEIFIPSVIRPVKPGDWVAVKLHFHDKGPHAVTGEIVVVYGKELPPSADIRMISGEFGLIEEHPPEAEAEARHYLDSTKIEEKGREDLRHIPFITIDGETARDFDDAVFVERQKERFILWVAIADVSYYVREGTALDKDARSRGTSVYFPERAFHMLPRILSENLCSLRPNEPKYCLVARITLDSKGGKVETQVMEAVIESKRRATYNQIQAEMEGNKNRPDWEYAPHFALYSILREMRTRRGSIDFELPEAELVVEPEGEVVSIKNRPRLEAHRLIEEFMIAANEAVTEWMLKKSWPFVYRIHEQPSQQSLEKFQDLASHVGVHLSLDAAATPKIMADLVRKLEGHPAQSLLNTALLRSMKQAIYSATHGIHYGLASEAYTHFTSPIRRYPDLVVHRLLKMALDKRNDPKRLRARLEKELEQICEHCSYRERLASDAERESIKLKQVRFMSKHLGEEFPAKVVGMIATGIFVQVTDPFVEGMLTLESLNDDLYEFVEERMWVIGRRKKKIFKIGDPIQVKVARTDVDARQIDFVKVN